jgi:EF hand
MNKLALIAAIGFAVAGFGQAAYAQSSSSSSEMATDMTATMDFTAADKDKDGFVTYEEARAAYPTLGQQAFDQTDINKDGKLDASEYNGLGGQQSVVETGTKDMSASSGASSSAAQ